MSHLVVIQILTRLPVHLPFCCTIHQHRGDLPAANVATVYTFGSPAVFCEGANGAAPTHGACHACSLPCEHRKTGSSSSSATDSLLSKLGLAADAVVNVIMTRDIVPRAFVCDYTPVAGVLKSWLPSFKEHRGLAACKEHKVRVGLMESGDGGRAGGGGGV